MDDRYFVIQGRRWRKTDPNIPEQYRQDLVNCLMQGRRQVKAALQSKDNTALKQARHQVNQAKIALGERGTPWWKSPSDDDLLKRAQAVMHSLLTINPDKAVNLGDIQAVTGARYWSETLEARFIKNLPTDRNCCGNISINKTNESIALNKSKI